MDVFLSFLFVYCFSVAADQVYGDQEMHSLVRKLCVDYMVILLFCSITVSILITMLVMT